MQAPDALHHRYQFVQLLRRSAKYFCRVMHSLVLWIILVSAADDLMSLQSICICMSLLGQEAVSPSLNASTTTGALASTHNLRPDQKCFELLSPLFRIT